MPGGTGYLSGGKNGGLYGSFNGVEIASPSLKCDEIGTGLACTWKNGAVVGEDYTGAFSIGFDGGMTGTWSFAADASLTHRPAYMAVKVPSAWALYALDGALSGTWSTAGLMTPNGMRGRRRSRTSRSTTVRRRCRCRPPAGCSWRDWADRGGGAAAPGRGGLTGSGVKGYRHRCGLAGVWNACGRRVEKSLGFRRQREAERTTRPLGRRGAG